MKIAFVALSGLRASDPQLIKLGLTFPGVIERGRQVAELPSLGLLTLAGMTPKKHDVTYFEVSDLRQMDTLPGPFDLVAISGLTAQILEGYALARRFRAAGAKVVMGGIHVTALPEEAMQHADAVVVGEGEPVWPRILDDAEQGTLGGIYDARGQPFDFANAALPAYELLELGRYNRLTVQTSRGCPLRCAFCASSVLLVPKYKQKPIPRILAELDKVQDLVGRPFIELADDNSFVNKRFWRELLPHIAKRRLRWFTETDISVGDDEEFLEELAEAGCVQVLIGLESPRKERLGGIELRSDWKKKRADLALENIRRIQSKGIRVNGCFIFGIDGQTEDDFEAVIDFSTEAGLWDVQITLLTPFPGTPLYADLKAQGRLTHDGQWSRFTLFDLNFATQPMSAETVRANFRELARRLYDDDAVRARRRNFPQRRLLPRSGVRKVSRLPIMPPHYHGDEILDEIA